MSRSRDARRKPTTTDHNHDGERAGRPQRASKARSQPAPADAPKNASENTPHAPSERAAKRRQAARKRRRGSPDKHAPGPDDAPTSQAPAAAAAAHDEAAALQTERRLAQLMVAAAAAVAVGLAMSGTGINELGGPLIVGGLLALVATIHFYGRLGPRAPLS